MMMERWKVMVRLLSWNDLLLILGFLVSDEMVKEML